MVQRKDCMFTALGAVTCTASSPIFVYIIANSRADYVIFPIYYTHSICSAVWLTYRLATTTRSRQRHENQRYNPAQQYNENLRSHLQDMEDAKMNGWQAPPPNYQDEIRFPIEVVSSAPSQESKEPTERLSMFLQYYCEPTHSTRNSRHLGLPIPGHGRGHSRSHSTLSNLSTQLVIA
jgi:hypothetical protein